MATYRAKCWLGSKSGYQELEVQSNTSYGAKEQFERIYGAQSVINLRQVSSRSSSSSEGTDVGTSFLVIVGLLAIWVVIEYWWIVVPVAAIGGIFFMWYRAQD